MLLPPPLGEVCQPQTQELLMYQLSNWWAFRVEEQGVIEHSHTQMVLLRAPLNRLYDEILSAFVAGWENCRPDNPQRNRGAHALGWATLSGLVRLNVKHIEETARMLLAAVLRGDQTAAEWLAHAHESNQSTDAPEPAALYGRVQAAGDEACLQPGVSGLKSGEATPWSRWIGRFRHQAIVPPGCATGCDDPGRYPTTNRV